MEENLYGQPIDYDIKRYEKTGKCTIQKGKI